MKKVIAAVAAVAAVGTSVVLLTTAGGHKTWNVTPTSTVTLAQAEAQAQPGDTISLSGVFRNVSLVPKVSGTASSSITYESTSGATFDGAGMTATLAAISSRAYLVFDGITFTNSAYLGATSANRGVIVRASNHITFSNDTFTHMQMQLIGTSFSTIGGGNVWRDFVAVYVNGKPQTSGDMLNLVLGSHDNEITGNDMKYAGHSLIELGNGTGNTETNANNSIHDNILSNPWYKPLILSDNGGGTIVEDNQILDASSVPTLYSTVPGQVGQLDTSSAAVQFSGENFILRNNTIANAVATYAPVEFGGRWYYGAGAAPGGTLVESLNDQVYGNTITGCKGAAVFSFQENYTSGTDKSIPRITGNLIHDNTLAGNGTSGPYSWDKSQNFETVMVRSFKGATPWAGLNGNEVYDNTGFSLTHAYRYSYVNAANVTTTLVKTLPQFEASDPVHIYGNG